jgi:hypothetical protein
VTGLSDHVRKATWEFRSQVASGRKRRRAYLTPEYREEAVELKRLIDQMYAKAAPPKVARRVKRIRQGASVIESRSRAWKQNVARGDDD